MISEGRILSTATTLRFEKDVPILHISIAFFVDKEVSYGFISGDGLLWFAKILHTFNINCLEELKMMDIEIEQDAKESLMSIKSKDTGLVLGDIEPQKETINALNSQMEVHKLDTKGVK